MNRQLPERVAQKLENLPDSPGCYLMYNGDNKVIYVGKAVVLRNRVRSYFHASAQHTPKTTALVAEIEDINWWVTGSELEALILENELIKRYRPRYNVRLKDDKQFPYIKVNWQDDFPKIEVVRRVNKDGARYFGPYTSGRACYQTLDALRRIFPYLDCDRTITGNDDRPCLYYHIKMCGGPCIGRQSREEYRAMIQQLMDFLSGDTDRVLKQLESQMERAAENLQFELAALYRDRLKSATQIAEQQQVVNTRLEDADYVALAQDEKTGDTAVQVFMVRRGRLIGRESVLLEGTEVPQADVNQHGTLMSAFLPQFYDALAFVPAMILVQAMPDDWQVLEEWLTQKRGAKVELRLPQRGAKRQLMEMAYQNASEFLRLRQAEWAADTNRQTQALDELQSVLNLGDPPNRIECYDISTFQGENTVGSMVVFAQGAPLKSAYKRFKIRGKGSQGAPDDFASMREMLRRRFRRIVEENDDPDPGKKARSSEDSWKIVPDLVIVDGGKGQLGVAVEVLTELGLLDRIPVVSLAKREEEIFRPGESKSTWLKRGSQALFLVQRIRDEAHRFAITYHRNLRGKAQTKSLLDEVKGIGPARRKALLTYYGGDIEKIRAATLDELSAVPGMNRKSAEAIKEYL
ncbi:MAG TPA: excinuclease ABC subunit UvrC [Caldilineaceae bacterium]|nr:excinuclease ABC subunit UvrC [Caldilineaceae bacterium]